MLTTVAPISQIEIIFTFTIFAGLFLMEALYIKWELDSIPFELGLKRTYKQITALIIQIFLFSMCLGMLIREFLDFLKW